MRILKIMFKEMKGNLRDKKAMAMMVLFPIVLITILGFAFSNIFNSNYTISGINVIYTDNGNKEISTGFQNFIKNSKEIGIKFDEIKNIDQGINYIKNAKYTGYIVLKDNNITLYKNDRNFLDTNIVESILKAFIDRFNVISVIAKENPAIIQKIATDDNYNFTDIVSLNRNKQPSSNDYYSVTMLTLIILYGSISGVYSIGEERTKKTGDRVLMSPVRKYEILTGKLLGVSFAVLLQSILVFIFSKYILGANWGTDIFTIFLIIISEIIFSISIGICLGFLIKNTNAASGVINVVIPFIAFLGGAYFPINETGSIVLMKLADISPIKWTNTSIFQVIFANNYGDVSIALMINIICAAVFIALSAYFFRKEAF